MLMDLDELSKRVGLSVYTLKVYLCRAEFRKNKTNRSYVYDMELEDIEHLKELIHNRIGGRHNTYNTWED